MASPSSSDFLAQTTREHLRTRWLGRPLESHRTLDSTNARALAWAAAGAPEGSTVLADHQTAGRGRHGRTWQARAGQSLTFSVILRPGGGPAEEASHAAAGVPPRYAQALPVRRRGLVALAGGLAVCEAVEEALPPLVPRLKWPNDVLLEGQKCCGVLVETASAGSAQGPLVLGIGLNVNQRAFPDVPEDAATRPTSLALAAGRFVERAPLLACVLRHLETRYDSLFTDGGQSVRGACAARMGALGQRVAVRDPASGEQIVGTFRGLAESGAMRLETATGERVLHAGDVTLH